MPQALLLVMSYIALLAAGVSGESPPPAPAPDCHKCGEVDVPYPFGIYPERSLPNFHVTCNKTTNPPILYTGNIRILSIALETPQIVVYNYFSSTCNNPNNGNNGTETITHNISLNVTYTPFLISTEGNMFTAVGCDATARLSGRGNDPKDYLAGCITYCAGVNETDDSCRGSGCCEASITAGLTEVSIRWNEGKSPEYNPCQYAFVAKKDCFHSLHGSKFTHAAVPFPVRLPWPASPPPCLVPAGSPHRDAPRAPRRRGKARIRAAAASSGPGERASCRHGSGRRRRGEARIRAAAAW